MSHPILRILQLGLPLVLASHLAGQPFVSRVHQLHEPRFAEWIAPLAEHLERSEVHFFRRAFDLDEIPARLVLHVSADYRYRLYVNGREVSWGPATSDLSRWTYETVDVSGALRPGRNVLAAQVWRSRVPGGVPARQISHELGLIVQADEAGFHRLVNTGEAWLTCPNLGYSPLPHTSEDVGGGFIAGATDRVDGRLHPWGWQEPGFDDSGWHPVRTLGKGNHAGLNTWLGTPWLLHPRALPAMEERDEPIGRLVRATGAGPAVPGDTVPFPLTIPARSAVSLLIDHGTLTMGWPRLTTTGGRDARIRIRYQESLFHPDGSKGHRDEWRGKVMKGYFDEFTADGGTGRTFVPLWLRVFRHVEVTVETKEEPLVLESLTHRFTAYPLKEQASFTSPDASLDRIWDASWRTARLCALETYMDCPYYEQLQYIGDTRLQALISFYVSGDSRLARGALQAFGSSLQPMGLTKSSHPSGGVQLIPPFSLLYVLMVHDYHLHAEDSAFLAELLPGVRFILDWFLQRVDASSGMLGPLPFWNHVDGGVPEFTAGSPPGVEEGGSAHISLLLALALDRAAELAVLNPRPGEAEFYRAEAAALRGAVLQHCWDPERKLVAESPDRALFTVHTNSLAVLTGAAPSGRHDLAQRLLSDASLVQPTLYFEFYRFEALALAGLGDQVLPRLDRWQTFLSSGLTTFPEHGLESRSDCHAWSAHPLYTLLATTAGIRPAAPRFARIMIQPAPGNLPHFTAEMLHPRGLIRVAFSRAGTRERYEVDIPKGASAHFRRGEVEQELQPGLNVIEVHRPGDTGG